MCPGMVLIATASRRSRFRVQLATAQTLQPAFAHLPAAFITRTAALIPFPYRSVGAGLSSVGRGRCCVPWLRSHRLKTLAACDLTKDSGVSMNTDSNRYLRRIVHALCWGGASTL